MLGAPDLLSPTGHCSVWSGDHGVGLVRPYVLGDGLGPQPVLLSWRRRGSGRDFLLPIAVGSREEARRLVRQARIEKPISAERAQLFDGEWSDHAADKLFAISSENPLEPRNVLESAMQEVLDRERAPGSRSAGRDPLGPILPGATAQ